MHQSIEQWESATLTFTRPTFPYGFDSTLPDTPYTPLAKQSQSTPPFKLSRTLSSKSLKQHNESIDKSGAKKTIFSLLEKMQIQIPSPSTGLLHGSVHPQPTQSYGDLVEVRMTKRLANEEEDEDFETHLAYENNDVGFVEVHCRVDEDDFEIYDEFGPLTPTFHVQHANRANELRDVPSNTTMIIHEREDDVGSDHASVGTIDEEKMMYEWKHGSVFEDDGSEKLVATPQARLLMRKQDSYLSMRGHTCVPLCETRRNSTPFEVQQLDCARDVRRLVRTRFKPILSWMDERIELARKECGQFHGHLR